MQTRITGRTGSGRRGSALIAVMLIVAGLMAISIAFARVGLQRDKELDAGLDDQRALLLAEAALTEGMTAIRGGSSGAVGSMADPVAMGGGVFWVERSDLPNARVLLRATAMVGSGRKAIEAVIDSEVEEPPLFVATLNSKETLPLNEGVMTDSYNSSLGSYASQATNVTDGYTHANMGGDIRSNMDVVLNARAHCFGDAVPGPGHGVSFATDSYVSGSTTPAPEPFVFPEIVPPAFPSSGSVSVPPNGTFQLDAGGYDFDTVSIGKNATLTVVGPAEIVVDTFAGLRSARLEIDARAGPVTIFVRESYVHEKEFESVPFEDSPMAVAFMIEPEQDIVFPSQSKVRGAYYAPNADILFTNENEAWGAFAANKIEMASETNFHFDEALLDHWGGEGEDPGDQAILQAWVETAVEPDWVMADRRDPAAVLGLDRSDLRSPSDGWE